MHCLFWPSHVQFAWTDPSLFDLFQVVLKCGFICEEMIRYVDDDDDDDDDDVDDEHLNIKDKS